MMRKESGFIFILALMFIFMISLLAVSLMQQVLMYYKAIRGLEKQHSHLYLMESLALQLINKKSIPLQCTEKKTDANGVLLKLMHHKGCPYQIGPLKFQYLREDLGDFPCLIAQKGLKKHATHHQRLSLLLLSETEEDFLLQIRKIEAIEPQLCEQKEHPVSLGVSSWRYLSTSLLR